MGVLWLKWGFEWIFGLGGGWVGVFLKIETGEVFDWCFLNGWSRSKQTLFKI